MKRIQYFFISIIAISFLTSCASPAGASMFMEENLLQQGTYVVASEDATATPTPFQPIPPTAVFNPTETLIPTATITPISTATPTAIPENKIPSKDKLKGQFNVLLLGADARPKQHSFRTDTIVLVTINPILGRVNLTSFPRDLYITIPGQGKNRINTAYFYGRMPLVKKTFKENFGITIDRYVLINFSSFKKIIDTLGGLDVKVGQPLTDYRKRHLVKIPKGHVYMDADTVLWYVRSRKTSNDFARNKRQQEVLIALAQKLLSLDVVKRAPEFYALYKKNVKTDIGITDVIKWIPIAWKVMGTGDINQYYISPKQVYNWITPGGAMVLVPKPGEVMKVLRKAQNMK